MTLTIYLAELLGLYIVLVGVVMIVRPLRGHWPTFVGMIVALGPSAVAAQERQGDWERGMHPMMWGMWGAWGLGMMLMMLVFWGLVIVGIVMAIRWLVSQGKATRHRDVALDILRERYARGEIGKEEFEAKKRDLE